jgi:hypothetical protein
MKAQELIDFLRSHFIPSDAEVVSQLPDRETDEGVVQYASAGVEYDKERNELIINIS